MSERKIIKRTRGKPYTVSSLTEELRSLGVKPGMTLLVHSSLSSIGWIIGGPVAVIQALEAALGPEGTLVMPTHTGDLSDPQEWSNPPVPEKWKDTIRQHMPAFDPKLTPTRGMGSIPETFRNGDGVLRSYHPQVSFSARGKNAQAITRDHSLDYGLGEESPLGRLYDLDGWILLLGVKHDSNTSLHLAEFRADFPGKKKIVQGSPLLVDGVRQWVKMDDWDEHSELFNKLGKDYQKSGGVQIAGKVGQAKSLLIPQRKLVDFAVGWIEKNYKFSEPSSAKKGGE